MLYSHPGHFSLPGWLLASRPDFKAIWSSVQPSCINISDFLCLLWPMPTEPVSPGGGSGWQECSAHLHKDLPAQQLLFERNIIDRKMLILSVCDPPASFHPVFSSTIIILHSLVKLKGFQTAVHLLPAYLISFTTVSFVTEWWTVLICISWKFFNDDFS